MKYDYTKFEGLTKEDREIIEKHLDEEIELIVDTALRVWNEGGAYIADVTKIEIY